MVNSLLGNYRDGNRGSDITVHLDGDFVLAQLTQRTFGKANFGLVDLTAGSGNSFGDITGADRTEQLAFLARIGGDRDQAQRIDPLRRALRQRQGAAAAASSSARRASNSAV